MLCYFLVIKQKLFTALCLQLNDQTKRYNSTIKAHPRTFVNLEQNNWARLLPMAEIAYNKVKNANIGYTSFKFNCDYHHHKSFEDEVDPCSRSHSADKLPKKLKELILIYQQNLLHFLKLQKQAHNKSWKPCTYASGEKIWLNSKYIKTNQN